MAAPNRVTPEGPLRLVGFRVLPHQAELLDRLAAVGINRSQVVREALADYLARMDEVLEPVNRAARLATDSRKAQTEAAARLFTEEAAAS